MWKPSDMKEAEEAASRAAPYLHAKLSAVEMGNTAGEPLKVVIAARVAQL